MEEDEGGEQDASNRPAEAHHPLPPYPFVPGKYGLNLYEQAHFMRKQRIETGSGRRVVAEIGQKENKAWIRINDVDEEDFLMHAEVFEDTLRINVYTKKKTGEKHPDFFAKHFLVFALTHFENEAYPVRKFQASWTPVESEEWESDNYNEYRRFRREGADPADAAKKTWTGKTLGIFGFNEVETVNEEEDGEIVAIFRKPGQTPLTEY